MSMSRRTLMAGGLLACPVAASAPGVAAGGAPSAAGLPGIYRYAVGDATVTALHEGMARRPLDAGFVRNAPFPEVQAAMARAFLPTDVFPTTFTPLLVESGGRRVLIDAGFGDNGPPGSGGTLRALAALGLDRGGIDAVVVSHCHPDHILGLRLRDGRLAYPNARILVPEAEWAFWMDPGRLANPPEALKAAFVAVQRTFGPEAGRVERYAPDKEVVPGLTALATPGHTPGHTSFWLESGGRRLLVMSDVTNHPALFVRHPDWSALFDIDADQARATRRRVLDMAASERAAVAFYHAPFPAAGHIARAGDGYEMVPLQWGLEIV